jgi:hypothetical protein
VVTAPGVRKLSLDAVPNGIDQDARSVPVNAPLTIRRVGSLSTRTTHPHYLGLMQQVLDGLQIPADIDNPYRHRTKGEMLQEYKDQALLARVAFNTVSCGKWKRKHLQCVELYVSRAVSTDGLDGGATNSFI